MVAISMTGGDMEKNVVKPSVKQDLSLPKTVEPYWKKKLNEIKAEIDWHNKKLKYILTVSIFVMFVLSLISVILNLTSSLRSQTPEEAEKEMLLKDLNLSMPPIVSRFSDGSFGYNIPNFFLSCFVIYGVWKKSESMLILSLILIIIHQLICFGGRLWEIMPSQFGCILKSGLMEAIDANEIAYEKLEKFLNCCGVEDGDPCANTINTPVTIDSQNGCFGRIMYDYERPTTFFMPSFINTSILVLQFFVLCSASEYLESFD